MVAGDQEFHGASPPPAESAAMVVEDQEFHEEGTSLAEADAVAPGELSSPVLVGQEVGEESREACAVLEAAAPRVISRLEAVRMRVAARLAKS